jgi:large subunit ribosomal protein L29
MAIIRRKDIKKLGEKELAEKMDELKLELAKERASIAIGATVTSSGRLKEIRRTIARLETERKQRSLSPKPKEGTSK